MTAIRMRENQIRKTAVIPGWADFKTMQRLISFVLFQNVHNKWRGRKGSSFSIFRSAEREGLSLFPRLNQLFSYAYDSIFKVDAIPG